MKRPLFALALVGVLAVVAGEWRPWLGGIWILTVAGAAWARRWWAGGCWVLGMGCAILVMQAWRTQGAERARDVLCDAPEWPAAGRVLEDARGAEGFWMAPVALTRPAEWQGLRVWWQGRGELPVEGSRLSARGSFSRFPAPRNPGEFDRRQWLGRQGMVVQFQQGWRPGRVTTGRLAAVGRKFREQFRRRLTAGLDERATAAQVIRAVVMGERPDADGQVVEWFRNSGTLHVFSVSGLHVAMVAAIGWGVLGGIGVPRRWAVPLLLPWIFGYAWLTGAHPPAVRAAWMTAVFLGAFAFRRRPDLLNALGAVLLVGLCWRPGLIFQPGVQLSYGVVAAIAIGTPWAVRAFAWMAKPEPYLPRSQYGWWRTQSLRWRQRLAQSLAVALSAGVGAAPLTAWHFGLVTPVSVIASVVLVPLVFVLLLLALVSVAISPVAAPVSGWMNQGNALLARGCVRIASGFAAVPAGHLRVGGDRGPLLLVYDLDHGDGAACFSGGDGAAVLIDCGGRRSFAHRVMPSLKRLGLEPDSVVLTHPDGGHLGGAEQVWKALPVRQVVVPVRQARSPDFRAWVREAPGDGVRLLDAGRVGALAMPDGARLECLHAPDPDALNARADDRVAVWRLHWRGWKLLWLSDAGMRTELAMLDAGVDLAADVVVAGRHRLDGGLTDRFLEAVGPQLVVVANDSFPSGERVDRRLADYWRGRGVRWIDQSDSGGVLLRVDGEGSLRVEGHVDGRLVRLNPPR